MKKEIGEERPTPRMMTVYYERASGEEEEKMMEAIENILCPDNSDEAEHDCRMHCIIWRDLVDEE